MMSKDELHVPILERLGNILSGLINILFIAFIVVCLYIVINPRYTTNYISSPSMYPYFDVGCLTITDTKYYTGETEPKAGDVIVYRHGGMEGDPGMDICHRIIEKTDGGYITKGDNNADDDSWVVTEQEIVGKVVFHTNILAPVVRKLREYQQE